MGAIYGKFLFRHAVAGPVGHRDSGCYYRTLLVSVPIVELIAAFCDGLQILVNRIDTAGSMHPAGMVVEALVNEELTPRDRAVGIQPFLAHHLQFGSEEERGVRIDQ